MKHRLSFARRRRTKLTKLPFSKIKLVKDWPWNLRDPRYAENIASGLRMRMDYIRSPFYRELADAASKNEIKVERGVPIVVYDGNKFRELSFSPAHAIWPSLPKHEPPYSEHPIVFLDKNIPAEFRDFVFRHERREAILLSAGYKWRTAHQIARKRELSDLRRTGKLQKYLEWLRKYPKAYAERIRMWKLEPKKRTN